MMSTSNEFARRFDAVPFEVETLSCSRTQRIIRNRFLRGLMPPSRPDSIRFFTASESARPRSHALRR